MGVNISRNTQLNYAGVAVAAANNTDSNSTRFDMSGWKGIRFFTTITDSVSSGAATLTVQQNTIDSDTGMASLSGATDTITSVVSDDLNGTFLEIDVYQPRERYVQGVRVSATQNIAFGEIYAELYGPREKPITNATTRGGGALVAGPAEA